MNSPEMKTKVLCFFRLGGYKTRTIFCATEAGYWQRRADVLVSDGTKEIIEVEVKITKADLLADKKKKVKKHESMVIRAKYIAKHGLKTKSGLPRVATQWVPTHFYFAVPSSLVPEAKKAVKGTPYGILEVYEGRAKKSKDVGKKWCQIVKPAEQLNTLCPKLLRALQLRCGSELIGMRLKTSLKE